jgi:phage shock protein PspC (stress-responsive transcriptional regulator)
VSGSAFITAGAAIVAVVVIRVPEVVVSGPLTVGRSPSTPLPLLLYAVTDLCYLIAFTGLAAALWPASRAGPLLMLVLALAAGVIDLQGTLGLVTQSMSATGRSLAATASEQLIDDYLWLVMTPVIATLLSLAALHAGWALLRNGFARKTGYAGMLLGAAGAVAGVFGVPAVYLLLAPWYVRVGVVLTRIGARSTATVRAGCSGSGGTGSSGRSDA